MSSPAGDRRARRRARREEARQASSGGGASRGRWLIPGLVVVAIALAAVLAIVLPGASPPSGGGSSSVPPSASGAGASGSATASGAPVITGASLPEFTNPTADPAVGMPAPEVRGSDFDGAPVAIEHDGRPKVVLFVAHWCPHCQREVPVVQAWVDSGAVPEGVDLISVATSIDPARPNYPPDAWFQREGWTVPVVVDPTNSVANAYGLSAFPYWVFISPDGTVKARAVGELPVTNIDTVIRTLTGS
jgi:cytochrome c biogenesis protein CcmG, thiol:disulfide interchange protein DsbE